MTERYIQSRFKHPESEWWYDTVDRRWVRRDNIEPPEPQSAEGSLSKSVVDYVTGDSQPDKVYAPKHVWSQPPASDTEPAKSKITRIINKVVNLYEGENKLETLTISQAVDLIDQISQRRETAARIEEIEQVYARQKAY